MTRAAEKPRGSDEQYRLLFEQNPNPMWVVDDRTLRFLAVNEAAVKLYGWSHDEFLTMTARDIRPPEEVPKLEKELQQTRGSRLAFVGEWRHWKKDRTAFDVEVVISCIQFQGRDARLTMVNNITERKRAEAALSADLDAMRRLQQLGMLSAREVTMRPLLTQIVDAAIVIAGADFGSIQLLDPTSGDLRIAAHRGFPEWWLEFWDSASTSQGTCGMALARAERVIVEDVERSEIFAGTPGLEVQRRAGVRAVQSSPLVSRSGRFLGVFSTHYRRPHRADERTLTLLDLLARQAADLIERAQAEEALRESEEKYRNLFENMIDEVHLWRLVRDKAGNVQTWRLVDINPAGLKAWRKTRADTIGKTSDEIFPGATEHFMPIVQKIVAEGRAHAWESYFPGTDQHLHMTSVRFGEYFITTGTDVTPIKKAAEALRESEERLRLAQGAARLGTFDWDIRAGRAVWQPETERIWGLQPGEFDGSHEHWRKLVHPDDRPQAEALVRKALADPNAPYEFEHRILCPDGTVRWVLAKATTIRDAAGTPIRMVGLNMDVTDRKQADEKLLELNQQLEQRVAQRTAQLADVNETLMMLNVKLLTAEEDERRRIARELHDDFAQRLMVLAIELTSLMRHLPGNQALRDSLAEARLRIAAMIQDIRTLSHDLHPWVLDDLGLEPAARKLADTFAESTGVATEIAIQDVPQALSVERATCLYRVLQESLQNVRKHAEAMNVRIRLSSADGRVTLSVRDDGRGFDAARAEAGLQGIGLASMAERVKLMGGGFHVVTNSGAGTDIEAWVPDDAAGKDDGLA